LPPKLSPNTVTEEVPEVAEFSFTLETTGASNVITSLDVHDVPMRAPAVITQGIVEML
jgi:hypothetical protein